MVSMRTAITALLIFAFCFLPAAAYAEREAAELVAGYAVPLPEGSELDDEALLAVEGELGFLLSMLILAAVGAAAAAGGKAIEENWFDEDYGIDRDDLRQIGCAAAQGAIGGFAGGCGARFVPI